VRPTITPQPREARPITPQPHSYSEVIPIDERFEPKSLQDSATQVNSTKLKEITPKLRQFRQSQRSAMSGITAGRHPRYKPDNGSIRKRSQSYRTGLYGLGHPKATYLDGHPVYKSSRFVLSR
jgi:hypothetical protein